jgi:3-oxoacyl-[acyl-carrier protein] reductase
MDTGLEGRGVLVTGGAGGIGSAIVRAFAREGARTAIHYRTSRDRAEALATEVGGIALRADLRVEDEADELVPRAVRELDRLDVLVANAGQWPEQDVPLWDMTLDRWRATLATNLDGVFLSCRAFLRHVVNTGSGNVVIIGSTAGIFGEAGHADYAAAKSASITGLMLSLKNEIVRVAPGGRVNAVCPGWTRTEMTRDALADESVVPRVTRTMALKKLAHADDVAAAVVALASDRVSGHITGQVVTVAGGMEGRVIEPPNA